MVTISAYVIVGMSFDESEHLLDFDVTFEEWSQLDFNQACEVAHYYLLLEDPDTDLTVDNIIVSM